MVKIVAMPVEFKYELAMTGWSSMLKGFMYVIREKFGAATKYECVETFFAKDDRMRNLTNSLLTIFKIEGNDAETFAQWFDVWGKATGFELTWPERSKTVAKVKITKCPWKTGYKDIGDWCKIWIKFVFNTINPKVTPKRPKGMCAGDPYCEVIFKLED